MFRMPPSVIGHRNCAVRLASKSRITELGNSTFRSFSVMRPRLISVPTPKVCGSRFTLKSFQKLSTGVVSKIFLNGWMSNPVRVGVW